MARITRAEFERLLWGPEGTDFDVKEAQYPFAGASDDEKGELLKDLLAFANAWRDSAAHILTGVREVKGGPHEVVGVRKHLDDASLQQFVNSKTNRPAVFSYVPFDYDGKAVGIIHIPLQPRPVYLKKKFGKLKANIVYIRRGSSTVEAEPDEVTRMAEPGAAASRDSVRPAHHIALPQSVEEAIRTKLRLLDKKLEHDWRSRWNALHKKVKPQDRRTVKPSIESVAPITIRLIREKAEQMKTTVSQVLQETGVFLQGDENVRIRSAVLRHFDERTYIERLSHFIEAVERQFSRLGLDFVRADWRIDLTEATFESGIKNTLRDVRSDLEAYFDVLACKHAPVDSTNEVSAGLFVDYKRSPSSTGDLHTYHLLVHFTNISAAKQGGYILKLLFPSDVPVQCVGCADEDIVTLDGVRLQQLTIRSDDTMFRGQTVHIVDEHRHAITYQMNDELYRRASNWRFRWQFYAGNLPVLKGTKDWTEMHCF